MVFFYGGGPAAAFARRWRQPVCLSAAAHLAPQRGMRAATVFGANAHAPRCAPFRAGGRKLDVGLCPALSMPRGGSVWLQCCNCANARLKGTFDAWVMLEVGVSISRLR